jgi:putative endonuclease
MGRLADPLRHWWEARRLPPARALGFRAEDLAQRYLESQGMQTLHRNWVSPGGAAEVDLIAQEGERTVFVEVKARTSGQDGSPERNIDEMKHAALRRAARWYIRMAQLAPEFVRFDLVTVVMDTPPSVVHTRDFLELEVRRRR